MYVRGCSRVVEGAIDFIRQHDMHDASCVAELKGCWWRAIQWNIVIGGTSGVTIMRTSIHSSRIKNMILPPRLCPTSTRMGPGTSFDRHGWKCFAQPFKGQWYNLWTSHYHMIYNLSSTIVNGTYYTPFARQGSQCYTQDRSW